MNLIKPLRATQSFLYSLYLHSRFLLPRQRSNVFISSPEASGNGIGRVHVINLDRKPDRWSDVSRELSHVLNSSGVAIAKQTTRYSAVDATDFRQENMDDDNVYPFYTLGDQLFVEPQPNALPDKFELDRPIRMSPAEIAVARSHIEVWKSIADGDHSYALVLEDDVWFDRGFAPLLDRAWLELEADKEGEPRFDVLYLSYKEVKHGARKQFLSNTVFRPERGLWYLSGYVLSRSGAKKLLELLPCSGPVDLWINHQFERINVRAVRRSVIHQRLDLKSTNSYSILPSLTKIGVLDGEYSGLFHARPTEQPVFAFGAEGSGNSSLAMALSMLGYRCCSDLDELPSRELENLLSGSANRVFNAYVNIGTLVEHVGALRKHYPQAKFIITEGLPTQQVTDLRSVLSCRDGSDTVLLHVYETHKWRVICKHLKCVPPTCSYPEIVDMGQQKLLHRDAELKPSVSGKALEWDCSPWVVESRLLWTGIRSKHVGPLALNTGLGVSFVDNLEFIDASRWELRDDTFPGNLGLFRPANVSLHAGAGVALTVREESLGVRDFSAAAISSCQRFLYGRFEVKLQAAKVPGLVTGFFLHRDSPRQEIDIEIVGARSDRLLVNVFYNPGEDGAQFDYGYRGAPSSIDLGFDAAEACHTYAIEWDPSEIRWFVDDQLVHSRSNWNPTPIPHLPMTLHVNNWPSRSRELAGRLAKRTLPASIVIKTITVNAKVAHSSILVQ